MTASRQNPSNQSTQHHSQSGFSIIELLIVVAIIAILILVAIPQYQRYTIRAQISEALSLSAGPKLELATHYNEQGSFTGVGSADTSDTVITAGTGAFIDTSEVTATSGTVTIAYTFGEEANSLIEGEKLEVVGSIAQNQLQWSCQAATNSSNIQSNLPSSCDSE